MGNWACPPIIRATFGEPTFNPFPGAEFPGPIPAEPTSRPASCGVNQAHIRTMGGDFYNWRIPKNKTLRIQWDRRRDDISRASVLLATEGCEEQLPFVQPLKFELTINRDTEIVWTGPITRVEIGFETVELFAEDILWVPKRRALSPGVDFEGNPQPTLAHLDNILRNRCFLDFATPTKTNDVWNAAGRVRTWDNVTTPEPVTGRLLNAWQISVFDELEGQSRWGGIDYTTWNRDMFIWDVNVIPPCMVLDELGQESLSTWPRWVLYGNQAYTRVIRTDGSGHAGRAALPVGETQTPPEEQTPPVDLNNPPPTYYESINWPRGVDDLRSSGQFVERKNPPSQATRDKWKSQAVRYLSRGHPDNMDHLVLPENTTLLPDCPWIINDTMAGSYFWLAVERYGEPRREPLRLNRMTVKETPEDGELVQIIAEPPPITVVDESGDNFYS